MDLSDVCVHCVKVFMSYIKACKGTFTGEEALTSQVGKVLCLKAIDSPLSLVTPVAVQWVWSCSRDGGYAWA